MGYNNKYYKRHLDKYRDWEVAVGKDISENFNPQSVIDFGCGVGSYLEGVLLSGVQNLKGLEINHDIAKEYTPDNISPYISKGDITSVQDYGEFDIALSVEAAEHINPEGTNYFIENLTNSAQKYIILTAAPVGQRGTGHINCRPKEFWISKIEDNGFLFLETETRDTANRWRKLGCAGYVVRNLMIFGRRNA